MPLMHDAWRFLPGHVQLAEKKNALQCANACAHCQRAGRISAYQDMMYFFKLVFAQAKEPGKMTDYLGSASP